MDETEDGPEVGDILYIKHMCACFLWWKQYKVDLTTIDYCTSSHNFYKPLLMAVLVEND